MSNYTKNRYLQDVNTPWYKIVDAIKSGSKVLDIGCGNGQLGAVIKQEKKCHVSGIEIDKGDAKLAAKLLDAVYTANLEIEPIPNELAAEKFDYIVFCDVIEHFAWPVETLKKIKTLLKPNGHIVFSIPNMAHMSVRLMLLAGRFDYGETGLLDKTHLHFYDEDEIYRVLEQAGYAIGELDWISRDYPENVLRERLALLGLKSDDTFMRMSHEIHAGAYQYVGIASALTSKVKNNRPRKYVSPDVHDVEKYVNRIRAQLDFVSKEKDVAVKKLSETEKYARQLQSEIQRLQNSLGIRLEKKSRQILKKFKK